MPLFKNTVKYFLNLGLFTERLFRPIGRRLEPYSIRSKIITVFSVFVILFAVTAGYSFYSLNQAQNFIQKTYDKPFMSSNFARDAMVYFERTKNQLMQAEPDFETALEELESAEDDLSIVKERLTIPASETILVTIDLKIKEFKQQIEAEKGIDELKPAIEAIEKEIELLIESEFTAGYDFVLLARGTIQMTNLAILSLFVVLLATVLVSGIYILLSVSRPIQECLKISDEIANGNLDTPIKIAGSGEFRKLFASFQAMTTDLVAIIEQRQAILLEKEQQRQFQELEILMTKQQQEREKTTQEQNHQLREQEKADAEKQTKALRQLMTQLQSSVGQVIDQLGTSDQDLMQVIHNMQSIITQSVDKIDEGSKTSSHYLDKITTEVDHASQEIKQSFIFVQEKVEDSCKALGSINKVGEKMTSTSQSLQLSTNEIKMVSQVISGIASEINMLALNASIEAARSGEAGKGFMIVANSIKQLSNQTEYQSQQIAQKVVQLLEVSNALFDFIAELNRCIEQVEGFSAEVRVSLEQKIKGLTQIIGTMRLGIENASDNLTEIFEQISQSSSFLQDCSMQVQQVSQGVSENTQALEENMNSFLYSVEDSISSPDSGQTKKTV